MDRATKKSLTQFANVFHESRTRNINEADTVTYLTRFFTDVLGYDVFTEITKEFQVGTRSCDMALKIDGEVRLLLEAKAAGMALSDRHIEQAGNYASRSGLPWVILTNGITWRLYHLTFDSGIEHDVAFEAHLTPDGNLEEAWEMLGLLSRDSIQRGSLESFWEQKKTLAPSSLVGTIFTEEVLSVIRKQLRRKSRVRLEISDIAASLRRLFDPAVLTEDIKIRKKRKKKRKGGKGRSQGSSMEDQGEKPVEPESDEET